MPIKHEASAQRAACYKVAKQFRKSDTTLTEQAKNSTILLIESKRSADMAMRIYKIHKKEK
ncbi:MAG: hypothetical protein ACJAWT_001132 [Glaciecola sp.]|jgi:hypothetical protein